MSTSPSAGDFARLVSDHAALARRVVEAERKLQSQHDRIMSLAVDGAALSKRLTLLEQSIIRRLDRHDREFEVQRIKLKLIAEQVASLDTDLRSLTSPLRKQVDVMDRLFAHIQHLTELTNGHQAVLVAHTTALQAISDQLWPK